MLLIYFLSTSAFHILKDTTIQFTLEKVPIDEDSQFTYLSCEDSFQSSALLRVEGKFVNPVQVSCFKWPCVNFLR